MSDPFLHILPVVVAPLTFAALYGVGRTLSLNRQQRHYRRMLLLYQGADDTTRSWFWQVSASPIRQFVGNVRISLQLATHRFYIQVGRALTGSNIPLPRRDVVRVVVGSLLAGSLTASMSDNSLPSSATVALLTLILPIVRVRWRNGRRSAAFTQQLPQLVTMLIAALRVGYSLAQAFENIANDLEEPSRSEVQLLCQKRHLGIDLADGLRQMTQRINSPDLQFLASALILQRDTGGNLIPMLETMHTTMRDRVALQGEIKALTAQQRLGGWVITLLPIVTFAFLLVVNPSGVSFFWTDWPLGPSMIGSAIVLMGLGNVIVRRMQKLG